MIHRSSTHLPRLGIRAALAGVRSPASYSDHCTSEVILDL